MGNNDPLGSADVHIGHRESVTSEPAGTWRIVVGKSPMSMLSKIVSVVTTTELSLPLWWLATIEP